MANVSRTGSDLTHQSFERILLIKPSSLGDIVHALPVLHGLRTRFLEARIDWLVASQFAPLLVDHHELDDLILFDRQRFGRIGRSPRMTAEFAAFVRDLRSRAYDLVIDLQGLFRSGFLARGTGAPVRIGFRSAREGARVFYTHHIAVDKPDVHAVDRNYRVSGMLGFEDVAIRFELPLGESVRTAARNLLRKHNVAEGQRLMAIAPGARWETKVWLPERFAETIDQLHRQHGVQGLLLGSRDEVPLCERITAACRTGPINLAGGTTLPQLGAAIAMSDVVLCHDSAAMHLAVAFDRRLVCLVGPTNPSRTGPYGRPDDVVSMRPECAPCYLKKLSQCRHAHRCMRELDTQTVVRAVERAVGGESLSDA